MKAFKADRDNYTVKLKSQSFQGPTKFSKLLDNTSYPLLSLAIQHKDCLISQEKNQDRRLLTGTNSIKTFDRNSLYGSVKFQYRCVDGAWRNTTNRPATGGKEYSWRRSVERNETFSRTDGTSHPTRTYVQRLEVRGTYAHCLPKVGE